MNMYCCHDNDSPRIVAPACAFFVVALAVTAKPNQRPRPEDVFTSIEALHKRVRGGSSAPLLPRGPSSTPPLPHSRVNCVPEHVSA